MTKATDIFKPYQSRKVKILERKKIKNDWGPYEIWRAEVDGTVMEFKPTRGLIGEMDDKEKLIGTEGYITLGEWKGYPAWSFNIKPYELSSK